MSNIPPLIASRELTRCDAEATGAKLKRSLRLYVTTMMNRLCTKGTIVGPDCKDGVVGRRNSIALFAMYKECKHERKNGDTMGDYKIEFHSNCVKCVEKRRTIHEIR